MKGMLTDCRFTLPYFASSGLSTLCCPMFHLDSGWAFLERRLGIFGPLLQTKLRGRIVVSEGIVVLGITVGPYFVPRKRKGSV